MPSITKRTPMTPLTRAQKAIAAVALLLLLVGLGNLGRAGVAMHYAARLTGLALSTSWTYLALSGLLWGLGLIGAAFCLTRQRRWARWLALAAATSFQAQRWVDHLLYDASDYARLAWPRDLLLTGLFLAAIWVVLWLPRVRSAFD
jgi:hypothetical protein